jgi:hypothetical protein
MSSSSRSSVPSPPALRVRKRAKTKTLLGDEYQEVVTELLEPPKPLQDVSGYGEKRLRMGLRYADCTLRNVERKLSPIGMRALMLYKDACARLLDMEEGEEYDEDEKIVEKIKREYTATIRAYEQSVQYTACLNITRTMDAQKLQDEIVRLQRTALYARYGDVLAVACRQLRNEAEAKKVEGWELLQKDYWTDIDARLGKEKEAYVKVLKGQMFHDQCPTHIAVHHGCTGVGLNMNDMLSVIHIYATRSELLHANLMPLIKKGLYNDLAKRLHDDFCDIPLVIEVSEHMQADLMSNLLNTIIDLWFNRDPDEPDNYQMWTSSTELQKLHKELIGPNPPNEADANKEVSETILKGLKKRLRATENEKEIVELLDANFGLISGGQKVKRVASSQLEAELVHNKRMKLDWAKMMNLVKGTKKMSDTYLAVYGEVGMPPLIVHDPSLDE